MKEYRKVIDFFEKRVKFNENKRKRIVVLNILEKKVKRNVDVRSRRAILIL